jgi:hypothetical protein
MDVISYDNSLPDSETLSNLKYQLYVKSKLPNFRYLIYSSSVYLIELKDYNISMLAIVLNASNYPMIKIIFFSSIFVFANTHIIVLNNFNNKH